MSTGLTVVTGASGFAGTHLLDRLTAAGDASVEAWTRSGPSARTAAHPRVSWRTVELDDAAGIERAVAERPPAHLYHLAGAAHVAASFAAPSTYLRTNVLGTHHLLVALRRHAPACRVVVVTSGMIYRFAGDRTPTDEQAPLGASTPYALSKLAQDQLARHASVTDGLNLVVARPFNHTGPGQSDDYAASSFARQIAAIEAGRMPPTLSVGNLDAARDLLDVRDVVAAYVALMQHGEIGAAYNIASGRATTMRDVLHQLCAASRVPVTIAEDPRRLRPSDLPWMAGDASRVRTQTGWAPTIPLDQTLNDLLNHWRHRLTGVD